MKNVNHSFTRLPLLRFMNPRYIRHEACRGRKINMCEAKNARLKRVEIPVNDSRAGEIYRVCVRASQLTLIMQPMYRNL